MAKKKDRRSRKAAKSADAPGPDPGARADEATLRSLRPGALGLAVVLAAVHGLWSLFQWTQLVLARRGGDYFCGLGEAEGCAAVWDLPLANVIQGATGLPVAGWGLVWSAVAFALPLWALVRQVRQHRLEPIWSAILFTALAGIASVLVLGGASLAAGLVCDTCVGTYVLVLAYAAACLRATDRLRPLEIQRGALLAAGGTLAAFLVLLYPGLRTPGARRRNERPSSKPPGDRSRRRSYRHRRPRIRARERERPAERWRQRAREKERSAERKRIRAKEKG